ncbi:MAG: hypothetical protein II759_00155, partial [Lachnospiraceae bacterium]|nr:hypothetical protein [Lachnospiraceae bacterium]
TGGQSAESGDEKDAGAAAGADAEAANEEGGQAAGVDASEEKPEEVDFTEEPEETASGETAKESPADDSEADASSDPDTPKESGETAENKEEEKPEIIDADGNPVETEDEEEKADRTIYYVTDEKQQSQYIAMFRSAGMQAFVLNNNIDQPFISQLEMKNEGIRFARIDADIQDALKGRTGTKAAEELKAAGEKLQEIIRKAVGKDSQKVILQRLKDKRIASILTVDEQSRRMQDMMKMYAANGMDLGGYGEEGQTLVLNANHPLVKYLMENPEADSAKLISEQLYDLARIQNAPLDGSAMAKFIERSNSIMLSLAKGEQK